MSNPLEEIKSFFQKREIKEILVNYLNNYEEIEKEIFKKLDEKTIKIMVYGVYNAGKSTFINTLLGKEVAKIGDIPTTSTVDFYKWRGYNLLDTPGINAPDEHEKISKKELLKSDLILFVIRKDDEDSEIIYKELFNLLENNKDVFVIFNYSGLDRDSKGEGSVELSINKLNNTILNYATKYGIEDRKIEELNIVPIDLKTALKGKIKNEEKLVEYSGFKEFEEKFDVWLKRFDREKLLLKGIKGYIDEKVFEPFFEKVQIENNTLQELEEEREYLKIKKNLLKSEVRFFISDNINQILYKLQEYIESENLSSISKEIDNFYNRLEIFLKDKIENIAIQLQKENVKVDDISINSHKDNNSDVNIIDLVLSLPIPIKLPLKVPLEIIKFIGIFFDNSETEKVNREKKALLLRTAQIANDIKDKVEYSAIRQTDEYINNAFKVQEEKYDKKIEDIKNELGQKELDFQKIKEIKLKIDDLSF